MPVSLQALGKIRKGTFSNRQETVGLRTDIQSDRGISSDGSSMFVNSPIQPLDGYPDRI